MSARPLVQAVRRPLRTLVAVAALTLAGTAPAHAAITGDDASRQAQAQALGQEAFEYGLPLMEWWRLAAGTTSVTVPDHLGDAPWNQFSHVDRIPDAKYHDIVAPNADTPYSMAHLDLRKEPILLHLGRVPRYHVFEFVDPWTNVFGYVGTRRTGDGPGTYAITAPGWTGRLPRGVKRLRSPQDRAWIIGRTLLEPRPGDMANVRRHQAGYKLIPLSGYLRRGLRWTPPKPARRVTVPTRTATPSGLPFFDALAKRLATVRLDAADRRKLARFADIGLTVGGTPSRTITDPAILAGLAAATKAEKDRLATAFRASAYRGAVAGGGWYTADDDIGRYGTDYELRAIVALQGLGANTPEEAVYPIGIASADGALLSSDKTYVIRFPKGAQPPIDPKGFWSMTMYELVTTDTEGTQQPFFTENRLGRYSIGDHTPGLRPAADGSLTIQVQRDRPAEGAANWLPAPASGPFRLMLRIYIPRRSVLDGTWKAPAITVVP
jgi:hypothetical protein